MKDPQTFGYFSSRKSPCEPMNFDVLSFDYYVTARCSAGPRNDDVSSPLPAAVRKNELFYFKSLPETQFINWRAMERFNVGRWIAPSKVPTHVVLSTPAVAAMIDVIWAICYRAFLHAVHYNIRGAFA